MTDKKVTIERQGPIAIVRFANPPTGTMDDETDRAYSAVLDGLDQESEVRVVVLTGGEPGVFIRHYDVRLLERTARAMAARGLAFSADRHVPETLIHKSLARMEASSKVFVAALNGTAMGGGFETALACDLRLAEDGPYDLGLPEINIGLLPGAGGTQRLSRLVGAARAMELMLLGRTVSPREAASLGLVNECVAGPVLPRALELAQILAAKPPRALSHIKRLARLAHSGDAARGFGEERTLFCDTMVSPEAIERMAAMNAGTRDIRDRR
jgi:enoyl-CoA hydratase